MRRRPWPVLLGVLLAGPGLASASGPEMDDPAPEAPSAVAASTVAPAAPPPAVSAVLDTIRIVAPSLRPSAAGPEPAPGELPEAGASRDPRTEPLFVEYARPVQLMGLADRLDLDRVRWRYAPLPSAD